MASKNLVNGCLVFIGSVLGSFLLVYFRLSNPIGPENGSWHGLLTVLYSVLIVEAISLRYGSCGYLYSDLEGNE